MNTLISHQIPHQNRPLWPNPFQKATTPLSIKPKNLHSPLKTHQRSIQIAAQSTDTNPPKTQKNSPNGSGGSGGDDDDDDGIPSDQVKILAKFKSRYNYIRVLEVSRRADHPLAGSRLLLLDNPGNIHSISFLFKTLTSTYFDVFATLPPILPPGPLAILGFGAASAARLILHLYPSTRIHGYEIDPSVIAVARDFFGLSKLEKQHRDNLTIHIGDALQGEVQDGFAGILVDLFSRGSVVPALQEAATWEKLKGRLRIGGRIMVNCGGNCVEAEDGRDGDLVVAETVRAMRSVFADEVFVLNLGVRREDSWVALTGPLPDLDSWKHGLPPALRGYVDMWAVALPGEPVSSPPRRPAAAKPVARAKTE